MSHDQALYTLAETAGLLVHWQDAGGAARTVSPDSLRAILGALGHDCGSAAAIADSLRRLAAPQGGGFVTADAGAAVSLGGVGGRLELESGAVREVAAGAELIIDEPGYHRLVHDGGEIVIATAPPRAFDIAAEGARPWGIGVQIYALRGEAEAAFGDFGALAEFAWAAAGRGVDALAISPVHALFAADAARFSPYSPSSRDFLNPLFIDPALLGIAPGPPGPDAGPDGPLCDWAEAWPARMAALRHFHDDFFADPERDESHFRAFVEAGGARLHSHALFEALHGFFFRTSGARGWQDWPTGYRDPRGEAVAEFARANQDEIRFHMVLQWLADASLGGAQGVAKARGMAIGLITDLAIGLDPGGSHAWSARHELLSGLSIGAPPDAFQAAGQNWGLASFSPAGLRHSGFAPFLRMLRAAMRHAGAVRIDHALGLRRLWLVPEGGSPLDGAYLRMPERDLLRLVALESQRARVAVIGEDLGVVPEGFRETIAGRGILGMRVLPFERHWDNGFRPPRYWDAQAVALTSTHDLPPVAGWWRGRDLDWRERLGGADMTAARAERAEDRARLWRESVAAGVAQGPEPAADDPAPAVDAALAFTASAACALALFPVEDLLGLDEAPNLPGTIDEHPNWRRRLPGPAEELLARPEVARRIDAIEKARGA